MYLFSYLVLPDDDAPPGLVCGFPARRSFSKIVNILSSVLVRLSFGSPSSDVSADFSSN